MWKITRVSARLNLPLSFTFVIGLGLSLKAKQILM
jgi:hypothetical protein